MGELVVAKFAGNAVVNIAELILECVDAIGSIVRGMKDNKRDASLLLERVEAIEPHVRAIQKKGTKLSRSESLRQLLESVQKIRDVLDKYARTCVVARALKRKKIAKKFARLGKNLDDKMHAVQLGGIADSPAAVPPPKPAAERSVGVPTKNMADVLNEAPTTVGQSAAVGAAAGGVGGALLAAVGAETLTAAAVANAVVGGALLTGIGGVAVGVGIVAYNAMNCAQPSRPPSS